MKQELYNEILKKSKEHKCFQIMINGEWYICDKLDNLDFKNLTLSTYIDKMERENKARFEALEEQLKVQKEINKQLLESIKKLNEK